MVRRCKFRDRIGPRQRIVKKGAKVIATSRSVNPETYQCLLDPDTPTQLLKVIAGDVTQPEQLKTIVKNNILPVKSLLL